jgi:dTDP-4-amino-4,6-dideoxygalactose transaminase
MFPLRIAQPEAHFLPLKQLGLPIWRWDSIAASNCPTANDYRLHLLHLPCHQSLDDNEMAWMIAAIGKVGAGETA